MINGSTFSAGELTTEIMKQLPNVTVIGDTTGGGGVASVNDSPETSSEFKMPGGRIYSIGSGYFEKYNGEPFESIGVAPHIRVEQTELDIKSGIDKQLEFVIQLLR